MLRTDESETEILLGNKQLFGIFLVVALLLGIAFTGGYMVGRGSAAKKAAAAQQGPAPEASASPSANSGGAANSSSSSSEPAATGGETHSVSADGSDGSAALAPEPAAHGTSVREKHEAATQPAAEEAPLGSSRHRTPARNQAAPEDMTTSGPAPAGAGAVYTPPSGKTFLQVAAVSRDEALAIADVLHHKGFRAHAVPKPGNPKIYRVVIGPMRDAGDLSNTRDALHRTGFRDVIVQRF